MDKVEKRKKLINKILLWIWVIAMAQEFVFLCVYKQAVWFGVLIITFSVFFFWTLLKKTTIIRELNWLLGISAVVMGILFLISSKLQEMINTYMPHSNDVVAVLLVFFIGWFVFITGLSKGIIIPLKCSLSVEAICLEHTRIGGRGGFDWYSPFFLLEMNGNIYRSQLQNMYIKPTILSKYVIGEKYTIYVDPKQPMLMCEKRSTTVSSVLFMAFGLFLMSFVVWTLF